MRRLGSRMYRWRRAGPQRSTAGQSRTSRAHHRGWLPSTQKRSVRYQLSPPRPLGGHGNSLEHVSWQQPGSPPTPYRRGSPLRGCCPMYAHRQSQRKPGTAARAGRRLSGHIAGVPRTRVADVCACRQRSRKYQHRHSGAYVEPLGTDHAETSLQHFRRYDMSGRDQLHCGGQAVRKDARH